MTEQLWGQDVAQVRDLARLFAQRAQDLDTARALLDDAVHGFDGWGPNVERMRADWSDHLAPSLAHVADALRAAGDKAARNADAQEDTSTTYDGAVSGAGNPFAGATATATADLPADTRTGDGDADDDGLLDWFGDRLDDAADGFDRLTDQAADLGDWFSDTAIADSVGHLWDTGGQLWDAAGGALLDGRWPRPTEIVASGALLTGALLDTALTAATGGLLDLNLLDDGEPTAGPPTPVDLAAEGTYPRDIEDLVAGVEDTTGPEVRVTTVETPQGPRVVVHVPGTQAWNPSTGANPFDLTGNLVTAGGGHSTMSGAVELAMRNADIPPGAEVMLVGHSQGGMTVADLVSDPDFVSGYNVTHAMTYGSPIDGERIDPRVDVLELAHGNDLVPRLDLGGGTPSGPGHTEVTFDSPAGPLDIGTNHGGGSYRDSVAASTDPGLAAYEQRLREAGFLGAGNDASNTTAVDIPIGRTH